MIIAKILKREKVHILHGRDDIIICKISESHILYLHFPILDPCPSNDFPVFDLIWAFDESGSITGKELDKVPYGQE